MAVLDCYRLLGCYRMFIFQSPSPHIGDTLQGQFFEVKVLKISSPLFSGRVFEGMNTYAVLWLFLYCRG